MQFEQLFALLQDFILKRGWKLKIGKKTPCEQSLFVHCVNELGALHTYLEHCNNPYSEKEKTKLYIAALAHDCGKERDNWQINVKRGEKTGGHVDREYSLEFIAQLEQFFASNGATLDFDSEDVNDIVAGIDLHMKAIQRNPNLVLDEMLSSHKSERWSEIASLVDIFDNLVSAVSILDAMEMLSKVQFAILSERLDFTYHQVSNVRGVLTSLLHKACEKTLIEKGFTPFLYFVDGTLYFKEKLAIVTNDLSEKVFENLKVILNDVLNEIEPQSEIACMIGSPNSELLLAPEIFNENRITNYFQILPRKFRKSKLIKTRELEKIIVKHFHSLEKAKLALGLESVEDKQFTKTLRAKIHEFSREYSEFVAEFQRAIWINVSKPQQYMFQLFKEITYKMLGEEKKFKESVEREYDSFLGDGAFKKLKSKSTSSAEKDYDNFITLFWEIPIKDSKVKYLSTEKQEKLLASKLSAILQQNINKCDKLPRDTFFLNIASLLCESDLAYPILLKEETAFNERIHEIAHEQITSIEISKQALMSKRKGQRLCPICNGILKESNLISAGLLSGEGVAKVFNNRALGAMSFQSSVNVCLLCYGELLLRRLLLGLGQPPSDIVLLFPSLNFERHEGAQVTEKIKQLESKLSQFYSYRNPDLYERIRLNDVRNIASEVLTKRLEEISQELNIEKFIENFKINLGEEGRKTDLNKLQDHLKTWGSITDFNSEFNTNYENFSLVAEDILARKAELPELAFNEIIEESGVNAVRYSIVYETPNFIMINLPYTFTFSGDEADVNVLLKRLLFACYLYLMTDCAVMITAGKEVIHIPEQRETVSVRPNSTLRQVITNSWISLFDLERWMVAISAATKLAFEGDYSARSGIFEILMQPTVGHILSRITSQKTSFGTPKRASKRIIEILDQLQKTEVLKHETTTHSKV